MLKEVESASNIDLKAVIRVVDDCERKLEVFQREVGLNLSKVSTSLEEGLIRCKDCKSEISVWKEQQGFYSTPWIKLHDKGLREWIGELHQLRIQ